MKRLRTITQAAKLRLKTPLRPKLRQNTRWGSTYTMLARYFELREYISADDEELAEEMPSPAANRKLKTLLVKLSDAQSVAMKLQCEDLNLLDARDLLNGLLEVMPSFDDYLVGFADRILKRRKANDAPSAYVLLGAIPPTSNIVERLFSTARMVLRYERNRLR
ncbi:Serine hydroxymethyltransferase [Phytophthora nicotianae]|uniref:Serine hydroxymethyltransferase n=1 Tax=Phytophthora nicotianae TaxID=4792 RepID=A0A0W8DCU3_PHYNI|nr:Serine hydroxymethyltransferase [Phytophthora nicotianae]